jgi:hypothetical protein
MKENDNQTNNGRDMNKLKWKWKWVGQTMVKMPTASVLLMMLGITSASGEGNQIVARPLTPQEIIDYGLPEGTERSGGLLTVGVGAPVYRGTGRGGHSRDRNHLEHRGSAA